MSSQTLFLDETLLQSSFIHHHYIIVVIDMNVKLACTCLTDSEGLRMLFLYSTLYILLLLMQLLPIKESHYRLLSWIPRLNPSAILILSIIYLCIASFAPTKSTYIFFQHCKSMSRNLAHCSDLFH